MRPRRLAFDAAKNKTRRVVTKTQSFDGGKRNEEWDLNL